MASRTEFETQFAEHRPRLRLHCYRMVGSFTDAEDLTQETALRAWRALDRFDGRSSLGTWLYRIATNVCLDHLRVQARHRRPAIPAADFPRVPLQAAIPWLQPYPGTDLESLTRHTPSTTAGPEDQAVSRDTLRLAFIAAVQYLPPRQRAALLLRDVLGWPIRMCADAMEVSNAAINSSLQRARATLRDTLSSDTHEWADPTATGSDLADAYVAAIESADNTAIRALLHDDVRVSHAPRAGGNNTDTVAWYAGVEKVLRAWEPILTVADKPDLFMRAVPLLGSVGVASWIRMPGQGPFEAFALTALTVVDGRIREVSTFGTELFAPFGIPLSADLRAP